MDKLTLSPVGSISVLLVLTQKVGDMSGYLDVLRDVLHNVCFVNNTTVLLEAHTVAKLHQIYAVKIHLGKQEICLDKQEICLDKQEICLGNQEICLDKQEIC